QLLPEGPDLEIVARPIEAIEELLAVLLDTEAELRLEAVDRLVPRQDEIPSRLRHAHLDGRHRLVALFRCAEERLAAEERVGECGDEVILAPRLRLPATRLLNAELLRLGDDRRVRDGLDGLTTLAEGRGIAGADGARGQENEQQDETRGGGVHG